MDASQALSYTDPNALVAALRQESRSELLSALSALLVQQKARRLSLELQEERNRLKAELPRLREEAASAESHLDELEAVVRTIQEHLLQLGKPTTEQEKAKEQALYAERARAQDAVAAYQSQPRMARHRVEQTLRQIVSIEAMIKALESLSLSPGDREVLRTLAHALQSVGEENASLEAIPYEPVAIEQGE